MIEYFKHTAYLGEYLEEVIKERKKVDTFYEKLEKEVSKTKKELEMDELTASSPIILLYEALVGQSYYEWEILYEQGWRDCIALLKELGIL